MNACSKDHLDNFNKESDNKNGLYNKAIILLKDNLRGPFNNFRANYALYVKKKRKLEEFQFQKSKLSPF